MYEEIRSRMEQAVSELLAAAKLKRGDLLVIGCSSSEVMGQRIGTGSSMEAAKAVYAGCAPVLSREGIALAVQCCEHLNRALIVEQATAERYGYEMVNVRPQPKAGGSLATVAWELFPSGGGGAHSGQSGNGHRRNPHWNASARGCRTGAVIGVANRRGRFTVRQDPSQIHWRRAGSILP